MLPIPSSFSFARGLAAVFVLAIVAAGLGTWWLRRARSRAGEHAASEAGGQAASQAGGPIGYPPGAIAEPANALVVPRQSRGPLPPQRGRKHEFREPDSASDPPPRSAPIKSRVAGRPKGPVPVEPAAPAGLVPPVLGEKSRASRSPWGLPPQPAPSAIAADSVRVGALEIRAASIVGPGHRVQQPVVARQDAYRITQDAAGRYVLIAIVDGMSDSKNSDLGANVAASAIVSELRDTLATGADPTRLKAAELYRAVSAQMTGVAQQRQIPVEAVRAVALAAVIPIAADAAGRRRVWLGGISDVSAWRRHADGWEQVAGKHKGGMDANALSEFLPFHPSRAVSTTAELGPHDVLAMTTDGVADAFTLIDGAAGWFADRWREPPAIASFILDVGYEAKTHIDDRTAVVVWCDAMDTGQDSP
jgi:hypothetical protein